MKYKISIIFLLVLGVLVGGWTISNKSLKEESYYLNKIDEISLGGSKANVNITVVDGDKLKITQNSKKSIDENQYFDVTTKDGKLTIKDNSQKAKDTAGIYYDIEIPKDYDKKLSIDLEDGNVVFDGNTLAKGFESIDIKVDNGNINLSELLIKEDSEIVTEEGNIDITLNEDVNCNIQAIANSGNCNIKNRTILGNSNPLNLSVTSNNGNVTVTKQ